MEKKYPIEVIDKFGQEETFVFLGDEHRTRMKFRDVWFEGYGLSMNGFRPIEGTDPALLHQFEMSPDGRLLVYLKLKTRIPRTVRRKRTNPIHAELDALLDKVSDAHPPEQHPELWESFLSLPDDYLRELASTVYIKDGIAGMALEYIGYPKLKAYLPELLVFLQDSMWPASPSVAKLLVSIGKPVIPHIKHVFEHDPEDTIWHYVILSRVVAYWPKELILELKEELLRIAEKRHDGNGADLEAIRILGIQELVEREWLLNFIEKKKKEIHETYLNKLKQADEYEGDEEWLKSIQKTEEEERQWLKKYAKDFYRFGIEDVDDLVEELQQNWNDIPRLS
jgi:hypothetical protein